MLLALIDRPGRARNPSDPRERDLGRRKGSTDRECRRVGPRVRGGQSPQRAAGRGSPKFVV